MAIEVALAVVVLLVAGPSSELQSRRGVDPGFARDGVLLAAYDLTGRQVDEACIGGASPPCCWRS